MPAPAIITAPRLNVFQRVILQWERLHPYNAAQAMRLAIAPTAEALNTAWRSTLADLGIGPCRAIEGRVAHDLAPGAIALTRCAEPGDLASHLSTLLNEQFDPAELPFRPFVVREHDGIVAGAGYWHWVCDSATVRLILREWLFRLVTPERARRSPLPTARRGYWHHYGPSAAGWSVGSTLLTETAAAARMRQCRRCLVRSAPTFAARFREYRGAGGLVEALRRSARRRGAKVNDLFVAALARASAACGPLESARRRRDLAIGTIVDLRAQRGRSPGDAFGLFLGFTSTVVRGPRLAPAQADRLVRDVAAQADQARRRSAAQASQVRMAAALVAARGMDVPALREFYRKRFPLAGGVSNVSLSGTWAEAAHPAPLREYIRVSPTGPFMPVVMTPTTLAGRLHLGVTTRADLLDDETADALARRFLEELARLA